MSSRILALALVAVFAASAEADTVVRNPASSRNMSTESVAGLADPELVAAVKQFEALGGSGGWFHSVFPELLGGTESYFYLVQSIPQQANPKAKIHLLKSEANRKKLDYVHSRLMAPIVLGSIPEITQVQAAAMCGFQLSKDALRSAQRQDKRNIILITTFTDVFTFAHETRHFQDQENDSFLSAVNQDLESLVGSDQLDSQLVPALLQVTLEIRGHAAQARQARQDAAAGVPYTNRAGSIITSPLSELRSSYAFEERFINSIFDQTYSPFLMEVYSNLNASQQKALLAVLSKYDMSDDPENKITFRRVLGVR